MRRGKSSYQWRMAPNNRTAREATRKQSPRKIAGLTLLGLALLFSIPIVDYLRSPRGDWMYPLGFEPLEEISPLAWILAVAVGVSFAGFTIRAFAPVAATWREISWLKLVSLAAAAGAATVEEAFFRAVIMDGIAGSGGGVAIQIAASALAFGAAHAVWGLVRLDLRVALSSAIATTVMGIGFALIYIVGGRALAPCVLSHFMTYQITPNRHPS